jgi:hypothetical protein
MTTPSFKPGRQGKSPQTAELKAPLYAKRSTRIKIVTQSKKPSAETNASLLVIIRLGA